MFSNALPLSIPVGGFNSPVSFGTTHSSMKASNHAMSLSWAQSLFSSKFLAPGQKSQIVYDQLLPPPIQPSQRFPNDLASLPSFSGLRQITEHFLAPELFLPLSQHTESTTPVAPKVSMPPKSLQWDPGDSTTLGDTKPSSSTSAPCPDFSRGTSIVGKQGGRQGSP